MRRSQIAAAVGAVLVATASVSAPALAAGVPAGADSTGGRFAVGHGGPAMIGGHGAFTADGAGGAFRYDAALAPDGAMAHLTAASLRHRRPVTKTVLTVAGLLPYRVYGAHLHVNACGPDPAAAGPHYQQRVGSPDDPRYANRLNEVWLDFRTDRHGTAMALARNPWALRAVPRSMVVHAERTSTNPRTPGQAGARVACLTLMGH
ncbi:superoxide dismutase family protein [Pilimelia columellifera]|uniref:Superoxide dismutase copper/zinc binding domain-containing protein n=1 Tax=Pilimelia columellifera subsp. columellifera TaxID=706583 RepID=A0ABP6AHT1_9ACTN